MFYKINPEINYIPYLTVYSSITIALMSRKNLPPYNQISLKLKMPLDKSRATA